MGIQWVCTGYKDRYDSVLLRILFSLYEFLYSLLFKLNIEIFT